MSKADREDFFRRAQQEGLTPKETIEVCWDQKAWPAAPFEGNPGKALQELGVAAKFMVSLGLHKASAARVFSCKPDPPDVHVKFGSESFYFEVTDVLLPGAMPQRKAVENERCREQYEALTTEQQKYEFFRAELSKNNPKKTPAEKKQQREELEGVFRKMVRERLIAKAAQYSEREKEDPTFLSSRPTFGILLHSRIQEDYAGPISESEGIWDNWLSAQDRASCELFPDIYLDDSNSLTFLSVCFRKNGVWLQQPVFSKQQNPWFC